MTQWIIPVFVLTIILFALKSGTDIFSEFIAGARENINVCIELLPTLIALITAVGMFRSSGAETLITSALCGFFEKTGFPAECLSLALIRPISGSGALAVFESVLSHVHPDSFAGQCASVMLGSTETTFYTAALYTSAAKLKKTGSIIPAALLGDLTGFIFSILTVNLLLRH